MNPPNSEANLPTSLVVSSLLVRANEGRTLRAFGHAIVVLLDGRQTGGKFTAFLNMTPPGGGPGPHYHEREDEWFYIFTERNLDRLAPRRLRVFSPRLDPWLQKLYESANPRFHQYCSGGI